MKRVFLDANIVIDVLLERSEWMDSALQILSLADNGAVEVYCSALSLGTASYFMEREKIDHDLMIKKLNIFCGYCIPSRVDAAVVRQALDSSFVDFEDALQYYSAMTVNADYIVTRNKEDFVHSNLPVFYSTEFVELVEDGLL